MINRDKLKRALNLAAARERMAIVRWLKSRGVKHAQYLALQIERGEHHWGRRL